ncbi:unnamed protein product [Rangifer tarandus platyrhynchus]|uniref:Uncharacterized protein n=1 Tax=Rangifer tarandus platyrhynchus TaxID=3082113 RepID=A0ABN8YPQ8_RANTA|nr:unnamed protein product [Rangifer tarandus platyrhynchus]
MGAGGRGEVSVGLGEAKLRDQWEAFPGSSAQSSVSPKPSPSSKRPSRAPSPLPAEARLAPSGPGAYLAGRRTRTSSSLLRAAPPTGPRAARAAPGLPRRFCRPRYDVAMATGRRRRGGSQAGDAAGGGRGDRKCPGGSAHPGPGPGPAPHGAWSGDRAPPGPNLDAGVAGTAARDPPLQRPGLRTRARVTFEFGPRDLASGVR